MSSVERLRVIFGVTEDEDEDLDYIPPQKVQI